MSTTSIEDRRRTEAELRLQEPPRLAAADRIALRLGLRLLLWEDRRQQRRAGDAVRTEQVRRSGAGRRARAAERSTFEHRTWAGPTW